MQVLQQMCGYSSKISYLFVKASLHNRKVCTRVNCSVRAGRVKMGRLFSPLSDFWYWICRVGTRDHCAGAVGRLWCWQDRAPHVTVKFSDLCVCSLSVGSGKQLCWKSVWGAGGGAFHAKPLTDLPEHPLPGYCGPSSFTRARAVHFNSTVHQGHRHQV